MQIDKPILILGSSSWLGHYLVPSIIAVSPHVRIVAAYSNKRPIFKADGIKVVQCSSSSFGVFKDFDFSILVNLTRGETPTDFEFHQYLIDLVNQRGGRYIYASSSNAVDGDVSKPHLETDRIEAQSEYGKFKARCEEELFKKCQKSLAFRFSAIHGWAPNRIARTEEFLRKLSNREKVTVGTGIVQNRTFVGTLASQILRLILDQDADGIFHLGTTDFSEEYIFLKKMASAFGYDPNQVVEGEATNWNLVTIVEKFKKRYPDFLLPSESETIKQVRAQPELAQYVFKMGSL